jgi:hypothetical protein
MPVYEVFTDLLNDFGMEFNRYYDGWIDFEN